MKYTNLFYFGSLNTIGGIETWFYNLSVLYKDLDLTVLVSQGSKPQVQRLSKNIRVLMWDGKQRYECQNLFICFNTNIIPYVKADKIYLVLHGDYEDMVKRGQLSMDNLPRNPKINEYIGITQWVCDSWKRLTGIDATLCYNPVLEPTYTKVIRICSAQRMSREKGRQRMEALANALDNLCNHNKDYRYIWDIYTNDTKALSSENVRYVNPRLDICDYYRGYDWFVALSDNEGYCYSVVENLYRGVPCVVTDLPVFREIGLDNSNSIKFNFDSSNAQEVAYKMFNLKLRFDYEPPKDNWGSLFGSNKSTYRYEEEQVMLHKVEALNTYSRMRVRDAEFDKIIPEGYQFEVDDARLKVLLGDNPYKIPFVKLVEEKPAEEVKEDGVEEKPRKKRNKKQ